MRRVSGGRRLALALIVLSVFGSAAVGAQSNGDDGYAAVARRTAARPIAAGVPMDAALTGRDPTFSDGSHFQVWKFAARAGDEVVVSLDSREFDAFLMFVAASGEATQQPQMAMADTATKAAQLAIRVPADGDYLIIANTQRSGATGRYRVALRTLRDACAAGGPCAIAGGAIGGLTAINQININAARAIAVGASVAGDLAIADTRLRDSSHFDVWKYEGRAGERIVIDQTSSTFDPYLILTRQTASGPTVFRENDDAPVPDGATRTENAQIAVELPEAGAYLIVATSYRPNATGAYQLRLRTMQAACAAGGPCEPTAPPAPRRSFYADVAPATSPVLAFGDTARARLNAADPTLGDGTPFRAYRFRAAANDEVAIFLSSRAPDAPRLDPFVHLLRVVGDSLAAIKGDDDGGGQKNALLTARLDAAGDYVIVANGLTVADTGNFTLALMRLADACRLRRVCEVGDDLRAVTAGDVILTTPAERIALGRPAAGQFDADVPKLPDGKPFQPWRFTARAGERIVATNHSSDFDAFLYLYATVGDSLHELARDDDGGGGLDAQIAFEFAEAGEYLVVAGSFSAEAVGAYRLTVEAMDAACAAGGPCAPGETVAAVGRIRPAVEAPFDRLALRDTVRSELTTGARRLDGGGRFRSFRFNARADQRVVVTMDSPRFDTHLHLARVRGTAIRLLGSDDDGGEGTDSRLVATLPENGEYLIVASAYASSDTTGFGPFTLSVAPCDSACAAYRDTPGVRSEATYQAALRAERRSIPRGGQVESALTVRDSVLNDGAHFHAYWIDATAGNTLRAAMQTSDFDAYLVVMRAVGDSLLLLATDDDSGGGTNARVEWTVDRTGSYVVLATAYTRTSLGDYSVQIEQGPAAGRDRFVAYAATMAVRPQLAQAMNATARAITLGRPITAQLTRKTPKLEGRGRFQTFRFRGGAGERVAVSMEARLFDTFVYLARIDGSTASLVGTDDDGGGGTNSRLVATLPAAGDYLIVASAFSANDTSGTAPYTIKVDPCDDACAAAVVAEPTAIAGEGTSIERVLRATHRDLPMGRELVDSLTARDPVLDDGSAFHAYAFVATEGMRLRALMEAAQFDVFLTLYRVAGETLESVASNDDGGGGTNALIEWTVERGGRYILIANALTRDTFGRYTLHVTLIHNQRRDP